MMSVDFFLGALSPMGFHGYFATLAAQPGLRMYLIKSGPGCGKSTLMKRLACAAEKENGAEAQGMAWVERIHCSSDPDSLDGVVFPQRNTAIVDATAPHTLEPIAPGAVEQVVSLYHTLNSEALTARQKEIFDLFRRCDCLQERASRCFASAAGLVLDARRTAACCTDFEAVRSFADAFCRRNLPKAKAQSAAAGREEIRLLSAVTPDGIICYQDTVQKLTKRIVVLSDDTGAASRVILEIVRKDALEKGLSLITCRCCSSPEDKIDHIILPEIGLAVVTGNRWHPMDFSAPGAHVRKVNCRRFADAALLRAHRARLRFDAKAAAELFAETSAMQREAHAAHDDLECYYKEAVNFDAVDEVCRAVAAQMNLSL